MNLYESDLLSIDLDESDSGVEVLTVRIAPVDVYERRDVVPTQLEIIQGLAVGTANVAADPPPTEPTKAERERDRLRDRVKELEAKIDRLEAWLMRIDGGDNPCMDTGQLLEWAMRALRGDEIRETT